ncbi:unnamed protein product [Onchocerca ochengi]|uniref:Peptidase A2 domain-containing protein n=1 Tax=Onchocerca ochengi TaxID=42157 RepID=A0A182ET89_ONCOC|nr:unnamed protein product [Onchocerca ochengi]
MPETTERVMAFFDIGAQMFFIPKGLADRLRLKRTKEETITIVTFGNKNSKTTPLIINETDTRYVENFWELELLGIYKQPYAYYDERALELFKEIMPELGRRNRVYWPRKEIKLWNKTKLKLNINHGLCFDRLKTLMKRLQNEPCFFHKYDEVI